MAQPIDCQKENLWEAVRTSKYQAISWCIYKGYRKKAEAVIRKIIPHSTSDDHDEIIQDTLIRIWSRLQTTSPMDGNFEGYFFTVLRHCAIDYARRNRSSDLEGQKEIADSDDSEPTWETILIDLGPEEFQSIFSRLSKDEQSILDLVICQELTYEEITERKIFVKENGEPLSKDYLRLKKIRALENLRALTILHFLDRRPPAFANGPCPDLLRSRYKEKKSITDMKKLFSDAVEDMLKNCLRSLKYYILNGFNSL